MTNQLLRFRLLVIFSLTALLVIFSLFLAYVIRFEFAIPSSYFHRFLTLVPAIIVIKLPLLWHFGCFKGWWRYVSMPDLLQILKANVSGTCLFVIYVVLFYRLDGIPRSVLFLDGFFCFVFVGGVRFITRAFRERYFPVFHFGGLGNRTRILIIGAGHAGQTIAREIQSNSPLKLTAVGFIDDDLRKQRTTLLGIPVLGRHTDLQEIVRDCQVDQIIIAIPSASGKQVSGIVAECRKTSVPFKILPGVGDLLDGRISIQQARDVDLEDLLGRAVIHLDFEKINLYLGGKKVLVSGAGGSIGSEICRQLMKFGPAELILLDQAESAVFSVERELQDLNTDVTIRTIVGDVCNRFRVKDVFELYQPQVVFHAAAYKHVPLMEMNPSEAIQNNVMGTRVLADAADASGVEKFVMISTDKAVRPTSVMGVSKRIAELYVQALDVHSATGYVTTRFGNVLGSNGSVIPIFKEQISKGGPVTVTHAEVTRFFMTIPEAAQLVLQAGGMGRGGEIYLFDMGEPVKIKQLAEELIKLSGFTPYVDIDIEFIGLRPGEKLYEELLLAEEDVSLTQHEKICIADAAYRSYEELCSSLEKLLDSCQDLEPEYIRKVLKDIVPEYQYSGES